MSHTVLYIAAWFAFLIALGGLAARYMPVTNHTILVGAALSPYLIAFALLSAFLLLITRQWWTASAALMLAAIAVVVELPLFVGSNRIPADSAPIRVLTANLYEGAAEPRALAAIASGRADVLVLEELTPGVAGSLTDHGLDSTFPYSVVDARTGSAGVGIWSRYPIVRSSRIAGYRLGMVSAVVRPPHVAEDFVVLAVHVAGPWPQRINSWYEELAMLPQTMSEIAATAGEGAAIVAGDFNSTFDMKPFRRLLHNDFRDAAEQSGAGFTPTYPANSAAPPLIGIDRILTHNSSATDAHTVRLPGSDHLGFVATIHVPS